MSHIKRIQRKVSFAVYKNVLVFYHVSYVTLIHLYFSYNISQFATHYLFSYLCTLKVFYQSATISTHSVSLNLYKLSTCVGLLSVYCNLSVSSFMVLFLLTLFVIYINESHGDISIYPCTLQRPN